MFVAGVGGVSPVFFSSLVLFFLSAAQKQNKERENRTKTSKLAQLTVVSGFDMTFDQQPSELPPCGFIGQSSLIYCCLRCIASIFLC